VSRSPTASSVADDSRWPLLCRPAQMAPAHHGVEHLVCGRTTKTWFPLLIALSTLLVHARRSSKTPRPEKVTKVARNCTEKYSVDWRPKSAFETMYIFYQARPNHAPAILGVQSVTRPKHVKLHAPGVQFSTPRHSMVKTTSLRILHSAINRVRILAHRFAKWPERPRVGRFHDREACSVPLQPYLSKAPGRP